MLSSQILGEKLSDKMPMSNLPMFDDMQTQSDEFVQGAHHPYAELRLHASENGHQMGDAELNTMKQKIVADVIGCLDHTDNVAAAAHFVEIFDKLGTLSSDMHDRTTWAKIAEWGTAMVDHTCD